MSTSDKIKNYIKTALADTSYAYAHLAGNGAIAELERKLCAFYHSEYALCVDSATNGLMYLLMATRLERSEILTTPLSYGGTIAGALSLDCKMHFSDIDKMLNICPESSQSILHNNPKIKAVIAVDFAGNPHNISALNSVCHEFGIWHFVDAAQSLGAEYNVQNIAQLCDAMVVSFGSGKTIFAGGKGGAIITNNAKLYNCLVSICQHAHRQERDLGIGLSNEFALNGGIHPLAATLACELFEANLSALNVRRQIMNNALRELSTFKSVSSICTRIESTLYHCPFIVKNAELFEKEFLDSILKAHYHYREAPFTPLSLQMYNAGFKRKVKSAFFPRLEHIIDKIYVLHSK